MADIGEHWTIRCDWRPEHACLEFTFEDVVLRTQREAEAWFQKVLELFEAHGSREYVLIGLDGLVVRSAAARRFGELRADVLSRWSRGSFRYGGDTFTQTYISTTSVLHHTDGDLFATRDEALAAISTHRAAG